MKADILAVHLDPAPQYNGNISWMMWSTAELSDPHHLVGYAFDYDKANRLLNADYGYWQSGTPREIG